jgi:hypothetical protein
MRKRVSGFMWLLLWFWATVLWRLVVVLLAVWLFVSKLGLIRGLNSVYSSVARELIGSFFCWQSKATMPDYNEVRCETDCSVKKLYFFLNLVFRRILEWLLIQSWVYWESILVELYSVQRFNVTSLFCNSFSVMDRVVGCGCRHPCQSHLRGGSWYL